MSERLNKLYHALDRQKIALFRHSIFWIGVMVLFMILQWNIPFFIVFGWFIFRLLIDISIIKYIKSTIQEFHLGYDLLGEENIKKLLEMEDDD